MRTQQENTYFSDLDKQFNKRLIETVAKKSDKLSKSIDDIITHFLEVDNSDPQQHKHKLKEYNEIIKGNNETVLGQYETMYDKFQKAIVNKDAAIKKYISIIKQFEKSQDLLKKKLKLMMKPNSYLIN
ncbi:hypothetical protein QTN25_004081 [Entamoeba marina]